MKTEIKEYKTKLTQHQIITVDPNCLLKCPYWSKSQVVSCNKCNQEFCIVLGITKIMKKKMFLNILKL